MEPFLDFYCSNRTKSKAPPSWLNVTLEKIAREQIIESEWSRGIIRRAEGQTIAPKLISILLRSISNSR
jgi:hypothetical protein